MSPSVCPFVHLLFPHFVLSFLLSTLLKGPGDWAEVGLPILALAEAVSLLERSQALTWTVCRHLPRNGTRRTNTSGPLPERDTWYCREARAGQAFQGMAETLLFGGLTNGSGMGEMAGAAAVLEDRGSRLPGASGKGHSSPPSSASILTLLLTMA